ncbi:MAG: hypothetical protein WCI31_04750 [Prolixibacteraceae bacterium]
MKITMDNYESWFLDYMEEKLSPGEIMEVSSFLSQHPDLAEELENFLPILQPDNQLSFPGKEMLKRAVFDDPAHFETSAVSSIEGDLSSEEQIQLAKWLGNNPDHQKFMLDLVKCKLHPNLEIGYPAKARLKKRSIPMPIWIRLAAAAAVLVIVWLSFYPKDRVSTTTSSLANNAFQADLQKNPVENITRAKDLTSSSSKPINQKPITKRTNISHIRSIKAPLTVVAETRQKIVIPSLESKSSLVQSYNPDIAELMPIKENASLLAASNDISLSDYLKIKQKELRSSGPKEYFTREEVTVAGLRLFSRLPGNHLTGRTGRDGRLTNISFKTQLLAFSIPVNR